MQQGGLGTGVVFLLVCLMFAASPSSKGVSVPAEIWRLGIGLGNFGDIVPPFDVSEANALMKLMSGEAAKLWCAAGWFVTRQDVWMIGWGLSGWDVGCGC